MRCNCPPSHAAHEPVSSAPCGIPTAGGNPVLVVAVAEAVCDVGGVETYVVTKKEQESVAGLIQAVEKYPKKICIDSGAGESVCPPEAFPDYATYSTSKVGSVYCAAGGQELKNIGEKRPQFKTNGIQTSMTFQSTTRVQKPLASASRITAKGNRIVLDDANSLSYIENKATGVKIPLQIENGIYVMLVESVKPSTSEPVPFRRQAN